MHNFEGCIYICIVIIHILAEFVLLCKLSVTSLPVLVDSHLLTSGWTPFGGAPKDVSNVEWGSWLATLPTLIPLLIGHSLVKNVINNWHLQLLYGIIAHCVLFGSSIVMVVIMFIVFIAFMLTTLLSKQFMYHFPMKYIKFLIWTFLLGAFFTMNKLPKVMYYQSEMFLAYKFMQFISYCMDICECEEMDKDDNGSKLSLPNRFLDHLQELLYYVYYLPYSTHLVCPYHNFKIQLSCRSRSNVRYLIVLSLRMLFWVVLLESLQHIIYVKALMLSPKILSNLHVLTFCALVYFGGQLYHTMLTVLFGTRALFAYIDGMAPQPLPVCIARISLNSRLWRNCDAPLYQFFHKYIYKPINNPPTVFRRVLAVAATFAFVCVYHGGGMLFIMLWCSMNALEITLEILFSNIIRISYHGSGMRQRLAALAHVPCLILSVLSIFFFLGDSAGTGGILFVKKVVLDNFCQFTFSGFYILCCCYCIAQCSIFLERVYGLPCMKNKLQ